MFQIKTKIIYNKRIKNEYLHLALEAPKTARAALPGQFVNIRLTETHEPLLRRPFSIHRIGHKDTKTQRHQSKLKRSFGTIEILYAIVGRGTEILSQKQPGEYLDIIGPLGSGFSYKLQATSYKPPVLVAGGMGVAPLVFLAEKLKEIQNPKSKIQNIVLIGAKTKKDILCEKEFKELGCDVKIATDDGSRGFKGTATELLNKIIVLGLGSWVSGRKHATCNMRHATIFACGPKPMLKEIALVSQKYNIPAQVSLEEHMACGIGACLGCVVKLKAQSLKLKTEFEYKRICKEGPVFNTDEIIW